MVLVFVLAGKVNAYLEEDPNTFTVTQGVQHDYFAVDSEFNKHFIAIGLQYKEEYENEMVGDFADVTAQIVDIEMYM